jgi:hypothetical protein
MSHKRVAVTFDCSPAVFPIIVSHPDRGCEIKGPSGDENNPVLIPSKDKRESSLDLSDREGDLIK